VQATRIHLKAILCSVKSVPVLANVCLLKPYSSFLRNKIKKKNLKSLKFYPAEKAQHIDLDVYQQEMDNSRFLTLAQMHSANNCMLFEVSLCDDRSKPSYSA